MDPGLLGLPLASPPRRAVAILLDLFIVAALTNVGGVVLGLLAAFLFLRMAVVRKGKESPGASPSVVGFAFRSSVGCLGGFILFVTIVSIWGGLTVGSRPGAGAPAEVERMLEDMEADLEGTTPRATPQGATGIRANLRAWAEDLGLGFGWGAVYFSFWLTLWSGRTPGKRLLGLRVVRLDGSRIGWWTAFERYGGYAAGFATGLLGFAQVYWDANRQATHDKIAGTVVILDGRPPLGNGPAAENGQTVHPEGQA